MSFARKPIAVLLTVLVIVRSQQDVPTYNEPNIYSNDNIDRGVPYDVFPQTGERRPQQNGDPAQRTNVRYRNDLRQLLQDLDVQASQQCTNNVGAQWNFETNVNQETQLEAVSNLGVGERKD